MVKPILMIILSVGFNMLLLFINKKTNKFVLIMNTLGIMWSYGWFFNVIYKVETFEEFICVATEFERSTNLFFKTYSFYLLLEQMLLINKIGTIIAITHLTLITLTFYLVFIITLAPYIYLATFTILFVFRKVDLSRDIYHSSFSGVLHSSIKMKLSEVVSQMNDRSKPLRLYYSDIGWVEGKDGEFIEELQISLNIENNRGHMWLLRAKEPKVLHRKPNGECEMIEIPRDDTVLDLYPEFGTYSQVTRNMGLKILVLTSSLSILSLPGFSLYGWCFDDSSYIDSLKFTWDERMSLSDFKAEWLSFI
jgi:hypothetical protein